MAERIDVGRYAPERRAMDDPSAVVSGLALLIADNTTADEEVAYEIARAAAIYLARVQAACTAAFLQGVFDA